MERTIIPIASGKGGVGKSFLAANLGIELAHSGKNVIIADLDFGGSNLHTCLGIHNVNPGIGDFLRARIGSLEDQLVSTDTENLRFLAGDVRSPFLANMHHAQKMRLIHNLKKLDCEFLILDLGSGSTYNTLDFFGMTQLGLMVTTTEHTSTMNMLTFLKLFAFRIIQRSLPRNIFIQDKLTELYNLSIKEDILTVRVLLDKISEIDRHASQKAEQNWIRYRPRIIFNKCNAPTELELLTVLENALNENLMLRSDFFGCLFTDSAVSKSFLQRKSLKSIAPNSFIQEDIKLLTDRITRLWEQPIRNSANLLQHNAKTIFEKRQKDES